MSRTSNRRAQTVTIHPALDLTVFREMADMSNDAFYLTDRHGRFLYVNDRAMTMGGYTREELMQLAVSDINPEYPRERFDEFVAAMSAGAPPPFETILKRKDGSLMPIEISVARIETGGELYLFGVVRDITERKQLETARKGFSRRLLQTLEAERQRVARELHDDVGQAVATVGVLLHALEHTPGSVHETMRPALAATHATIRQITESVAHIVRDYHPAELLGLGFEETLRTHVVQFTQRHGLGLQLATVPVAGVLQPEQELHLYRIAQEALANVARHARARRVVVRIGRQRTRVTLLVRDDGVGFDPGATDVARGLGLVTMRERAEMLGASFAFRSSPGRGTSVHVAVQLGRGSERRGPGEVTETTCTPSTSQPPRDSLRSRRRRPLSLA